jgi:glutamate racemase
MESRVVLGITDSGFGGLTVLQDIVMSNLNVELIYFGDLKNSPYGTKSKELVRDLVQKATDFLIDKGCNAILLACNTATSVTVEYLRSRYSIPIFGMEPAIKPALVGSDGSKIAVLATKLTLEEDRFLSLKNRVDPMNLVIPIPCPGLSDLVDREDWANAEDYIIKILNQPELQSIHFIVLGCTHYLFLKDMIHSHRPDIEIFDGNQGTVDHILRSCYTPSSKPLPIHSSSTSDSSVNGIDRSSIQLYFNQDEESNRTIANKLLHKYKEHKDPSYTV